jgi:polysaccharide deacetylase family protein (PEP-CTERM system associated)
VDRPPDILTVDVEEWFHGHNYLAHVPPTVWDEQESRVVANTEHCLELCARYGIRATFFVLGWTAARHPELIARIAADGHEIGCHSYAHPELYSLDDDAFRHDLDRALAALADAGIDRVAGYRAPSFSLTAPVHHFLKILAEYGFRYDCSLFPVHHPRYGQPHAPRRPFRFVSGPAGPHPAAADGDDLVVVPMTTWRLLGVNLPFAGGGYLRLLPLPVYRAMRDRARAQGIANIVYLHPWELDDYRPDTGQARWLRLRSQGGQATMPIKLAAILSEGRFQTLGDHVARLTARGGLPRRSLPLRSGV